jgi:hypothetical protein
MSSYLKMGLLGPGANPLQITGDISKKKRKKSNVKLASPRAPSALVQMSAISYVES